MRVLSFTFMLLFCSHPMVAQTVRIQSGEHEDFTRLVFNIPEDATWEITPNEPGLLIAFSVGRIDAQNAFDLIPRNRVSEISVDENTAQISLNCPCQYETFLVDGGFLVVDILNETDPSRVAALDATSTNLSRPQNSRAFYAPEPDELSAGFQSEPDEDTRSLTLPVEEPEPITAPALELTSMTQDIIQGLGFEERKPIEAPASPDVSSLQDNLISGLSNALSRGLLEIAERSQRKETEDDESEVSSVANLAPDGASSPIIDAEATLPDLAASIEVTDATQLNSDQETDTSLRNFDGDACFEASYFSGFDAVDDRDFWSSVSSLRASLYGEFDRVEPTIRLALIKEFLAHGFGAEARNLLDLAPDNSEISVYRDLSYLVDGEPPLNSEAWAMQLTCAGPSAMWSAIALDELPTGTQIPTEDILKGFQALPVAMRRYIGPKLSQKFANLGDTRTAAALNRAVERTVDDTPEAVMLSEAIILQQKGELQQADRLLSQIIGSSSETGTEAILRLVDLRVMQDLGLSDFELDLLSSHSFIQREEPSGLQLQLALIKALILNQRYQDAFELIEIYEDDLDIEIWVSKQIADNASTDEFLIFAFEPPTLKLNLAAHSAFQDRLISFGFVDDLPSFGNSDIEIEFSFQDSIKLSGRETPVEMVEVAQEILDQSQDLLPQVRNYLGQ